MVFGAVQTPSQRNESQCLNGKMRQTNCNSLRILALTQLNIKHQNNQNTLIELVRGEKGSIRFYNNEENKRSQLL